MTASSSDHHIFVCSGLVSNGVKVLGHTGIYADYVILKYLEVEECNALLARYTQCIRQPSLALAKLCALIAKLEIAVWHRHEYYRYRENRVHCTTM